MKFEYNYSATQQQEIENIRNKYLPKEENKMETLRKLDKSAEKPGMITSLAVGIIGTLLLGVGMCCTMVWSDSFFVLGIIVGIIGIGVASIAYPLYRKITRKQRAKVAEQILALSEEIAK
ncbi:MAG: hypothetical protein J6L69_08305 [Lachnospiraceae bacterium]|nr:hypothetical protein [Lachnospiraceae bacterium]